MPDKNFKVYRYYLFKTMTAVALSLIDIKVCYDRDHI